MARKIEDLRCQRRPQTDERILRVQARLREPSKKVLRMVEPLMRLRDFIDDLRVDTQRFPSFAERAARTIRRDSCCNRGSLAPILSVDVLNDLAASKAKCNTYLV